MRPSQERYRCLLQPPSGLRRNPWESRQKFSRPAQVQALFPPASLPRFQRRRFGQVTAGKSRLAGVIGPGEDGAPSSPEELIAARAALGLALSGHHLSLAIMGAPDRYQRVAGHVFADGIWVQDTMLRQGLLRVGPDRPGGGCMTAILIAEDSAIFGKMGHWGDERYRIRTPDQVTKSAGRFETVEGEVWRVRLVKGREIIEFANASRFQLIILPQATRALRSRGIDVRRLRGRTVRARGWIGFDDTPAMEISSPDGMELLSGKLPGRL